MPEEALTFAVSDAYR